ncbi:hypothetical protein GCM10011273_32510 [Asticcacaulis endophyticus]|uniref:Uncharacterized protein n=2 Tax=Asticcacaulis endophyticus TaxID=1395890 RepID=A0A918UYV9_9CAUL|nr:hypothetical protein GCM10011273_32510 [Asticcacaulis endophyticus]
MMTSPKPKVIIMPKQTPAQSKKVEKVMHEFKEGDLKSSSGDKVKSRKQIVAIALREADIPKKGETARKD